MAIINYLTTIHFGERTIDSLADDLSQIGIMRPLIVTDRGVVTAGLLCRVENRLGDNLDRFLYCDTPSNPTEEEVLKALALYRENGCDGIVAVGGGSPIDLGKAVALLATHSAPLAQYAAIDGGAARIAVTAPLVAIPTTAGTGSEVGRAALITLNDGRKLGFISSHLIPRLAVCDPTLTLGLPPLLTAATGMDAIAHCIETYLSPRTNPPAESIAIDGLRRAFANIRQATNQGDNCHARTEMMMAALEGGLTFQKGLGAVHGLSHALGSLKEPSMHHGMLNAILLPEVLNFNEAAVSTAKWKTLCSATGCPCDIPLSRHLATLVDELGLPTRLAELCYEGADIDLIVDRAMRDHSTPTNPRLLSDDDYRAILIASI